MGRLEASGYGPIGQVFAVLCQAQSTPMVHLGGHVYCSIAQEVSAFLTSLLDPPPGFAFSPN